MVVYGKRSFLGLALALLFDNGGCLSLLGWGGLLLRDCLVHELFDHV